jgi:hypothetical protein
MRDNDLKTRKTKKKGIVRRSAGKAYSALGFKAIVDGIGDQVDNAIGAAERGKKLFNAYRSAVTEKKEARVETFEDAVVRLKLSEADLSARRRELTFTSYVFTLILAVTFYFLATALLDEEFVNAFTLLTICLTVGAVVFSTRFRVWQIEKRRLGAPSEYIDALLGKG